jgi:enoyl-CoA hydratase
MRGDPSSDYARYSDLTVRRDGPVATVVMAPSGDAQYERHQWNVPQYFPKHRQIGQCISELRLDSDVRVIILTGDGEHFFVPPSASPGGGKGHTPRGDWELSQAVSNTILTMLECEKPIIARVNGDAVGFGSSLVFASDFAVAVDDALIADHHLGMGDLPYGRSDVGVVPGDGGVVVVPPNMSPARVREYLMLAKGWPAAELAKDGCISRAVPREELDAVVDDYARRVLARPMHAIGWTKRALNRDLVARYALTFDVAWAYEVAGFHVGDPAAEPG